MQSEHRQGGNPAARYRQLLEGTLDAFILIDAWGVVREWNSQAGAIFGWSEAEALGRNLGELIVPQRHREAHRQWAERGELTEQPFFNKRIETETVHRGGHEVAVELSIMPIHDAGSVMFGAFIRDITTRKQAEEALRRSEASFRALIETLPDAVVVHRNGPIAYANPASLRLFGYENASKLIGRSVLDLVHPSQRAEIAERMAGIAATGAQSSFHEECLIRQDGSIVTAEVTGLPVTFDGSPAVATVAHDVTEKRQMLTKLAEADRLAGMGLLAASVAHEVNNPLAYVLLNLERLTAELPQVGKAFESLRGELDSMLGEEQAAALFKRTGAMKAIGSVEGLAMRVQTVTEGARQVGRIARDLTAFARVEQDERGPVDINMLLDRVIDIAANEIRFRAKVARQYGALPLVRANEGRLSQVFLNLIVNAAHAIDEGAADQNVIQIATAAASGDVRISVTDSGRGIAKEHLPRLFDAFFTTKVRGQGSGLGLSICRDIVLAHGGRIEVDSELEYGSRFTVHLPVGDAGQASTTRLPASARAPRSRNARRPRVLVVDDERTLRATLAALLEDHYDATLADSGQAAFELLARDRDYDAILCDLMMPGVSGMEVHAWVSREAPELLDRMVFMTGGAFTRNASDFLESVSNRYIEKPFEVRQLIEVLERVVKKKSAEPTRARP